MEVTSRNILSGYAYFLAEQQYLDKQTAIQAFNDASHQNIPYIEFLIKQKLLNESAVARTTSEYFGFPHCDIEAFNLEIIPTEYLNIQLVRKRIGIPLFKKNGLLYLALSDPTSEYLHEIKFLTGFDTRVFIVEMSKLEHTIDAILSSLLLTEINGPQDKNITNVSVNVGKEEEEVEELSIYDVESAPVVNYVNRVLLEAIEKNASDIHMEHYENNYRIRFRQHGLLYQVKSPPAKLANYILARIKVMSNLDITEHRIPQDGRFKLTISRKRAVDFRVSICPTLFGEKIVLRILDTAQSLQKISDLGMNPDQQNHFAEALQHSQGMILVTGPTGSGKTVTLYTALHLLNSIEKNISTVEDPVEIPVSGINQVNVNLKTGLTFATALRAFLRQDPDIIMVGEIRDLETAEIAVKASQTGHLVLSTLHTNSAPETIARLMNMGIEPYNIASSLTIVIAQRLVRILCDHCKKPMKLSEDVLLKEGFTKSDLSEIKLFEPVGCEQCIQGFKGRLGIFEVMPISDEMRELMMRKSNAIQLSQQAKKEGINSLRESGLKSVKQGVTSLAELNRVFK